MAQAKRLTRNSSTNKQLAACDGANFYYGLGGQQISRLPWASREDSTAGTAGHDFGAGFEVTDIFADERQPGIVYAVVRTSATNKYSVYRSANSGTSFIFEKRLGDVDGTDGNQLARNGTLEGGTGICLHDFADGNGLQLYLVEYDPSGGNDVRFIKRNGAGVWSTIWNSSGAVKHLHCVRSDPFSNTLYVGSGDTDAQTFIAQWDGVNAWVDGVLPTVAGVAGLVAVGGSQSHRAVDLLFDQDYVYWMADTASNTPSAGIWRMNKAGLAGMVRIDNKIAGYGGTYRYGWRGLTLPDGNIYIADSAVADPNNDCNFLYGKKSIYEFEIIGQFNQRAGGGGTAGQFRIGYNNGVIWATYSAVAGRHSAFTGYYTVGEDFCEERPDILAPLAYVGSTGTDDSSTHGATPDLPFASINYALTGSHITYGTAVILQNDVSSNRMTMAWDNYAFGTPSRAGRTGQPVQLVSGGGVKRTVTHLAGDTNTNYINWSHDLQTLELDGVDVDTGKAGDDIFIGPTTTATAKLVTRDATIGASGLHTNAVQYRRLTVWSIRSEWRPGSGAESLQQYDATRAGHLKAIASTFDNASYAAYLRGAGDGDVSSLEIYNCAITGAGNYGLERVDTSASDPIVKNCVFNGQVLGSLRYNGGTANGGGASHNCLSMATTPAGNDGVGSVINAANASLYQGGDVTSNPIDDSVKAGGTAIPNEFPLPKYDAGKKPFNPLAMPIGIRVAADPPPVITLIGSSAVSIVQGFAWVDPGATAKDGSGNDINPALIIVSGSVDVHTPGVYQLRYNVSVGGLAADEVIRTITVTALEGSTSSSSGIIGHGIIG